LFDWCAAAALAREKFQTNVVAEKAKVSDLEARIAELKSQLDELTESKKAREDELLEKFCGLLNEKKVKIREQQRLLSVTQVDPSRLDAARASQAARSMSPEDRKPAIPRTIKRKATSEVAAGDDDSDSDDGFEKVTAGVDKMDVDPKERPLERKESPESEEDRETTDEGEATASGSEDEDEEVAPQPPPPAARQQPKAQPKGRAAASTSKAGKGKDVSILPKRTLRKQTPKAASPPPAEGSETESDDEL